MVWGLAFSLVFSSSWAAEEAKKEKEQEKEKEKSECQDKEESSETKHQVVINGQPVAYRAVAGTLILKDENCKPKASMFYISYTKEGANDLRNRPVLFASMAGPDPLLFGCI